MKATTAKRFRTTVAARVAGEDINHGDYITVLSEIVELPSFLWSCTSATLAADEPVRIQYKPCDAGQPYKVIAVCLPFVYVKRPKGSVNIIDTRQQQLVRLDPDRSRSVWKQMRKAIKKKRN